MKKQDLTLVYISNCKENYSKFNTFGMDEIEITNGGLRDLGARLNSFRLKAANGSFGG